MRAPELAARVRTQHGDAVLAREEVTLLVGRDELVRTLARLHEDPELSLDFLSSIWVTDWPGREPRFWLAYELLSLAHNHRLRVKVGLAAVDPRVPSITSLFPTADWHEREAYDFFGIEFVGHPNLRRILLPDGWEGWPLRKDEALGGVDTRYRGAFIPPVDRRTP
jgi:NADH-quinone oxidoreductase subunit C